MSGFQNERLGNSFGHELFKIVVVHALDPQPSRVPFNRKLEKTVGVLRIQRMKSPLPEIGFVVRFNDGNRVAEFPGLPVAPRAADGTCGPFFWEITCRGLAHEP